MWKASEATERSILAGFAAGGQRDRDEEQGNRMAKLLPQEGNFKMRLPGGGEGPGCRGMAGLKILT